MAFLDFGLVIDGISTLSASENGFSMAISHGDKEDVWSRYSTQVMR